MENNFESQDKEELQLQPLLKECCRLGLKYWYWFVLTVVLSLVIGWFYQQRMPRVYQRQAVMLLEGSESGGGISGASRRVNMNNILDLDGVSVGGNLKNEIYILSSKRLMKRVVKKLNLQTDYTIEERLHTRSLYGKERPFEILFQDSLRGASRSFTVEQSDNEELTLTDFTDKKGNQLPDMKVRFGQTVKTPAGLLTVIRKEGYSAWNGTPITVRQTTTDITASRFMSEISVTEYDKESSLIVIGCNDVNVRRADDILLTLYETYKEDVIENKNRVALGTAKFIEERIKLIESELSSVENQLADFKRQNRIIGLEHTAQTAVTESAAARQKSLQIETELNVANYLNDYLASHSASHDLIPDLSLGAGAPTEQVSAYNHLMIERNRTASNTSEQQQIVQEMDRQLVQMRKALTASLQNYIRTVSLRLQDAKRNEAFINAKISNVPEQEKRGLDIKRQQSLKEVLYTYLLNKREEVALKQAVNEANVRLVEEPYGGHSFISPRIDVILLISGIVGLLIPALFVWLKIKLDVTVHNRSDLEALTTIPLLGEVPRLKSTDPEAKISALPSDDPVTEAFRIIRFNLGYMRYSTQVMLTTSTTPGQGKSFISKNMAIILSMAGKKVLLIDADIRKRTLSSSFRQPFGLTTYLADPHTAFSDLIIKDGIEKNVDFLPAGPIPPNPSELLMTPRLDSLIEEARKEYDHILFDATPMFAVADANIVERVADITLFVIRAGVQDKAFLPELERMYRNERFNNLSIVLNDANIKDGRYGYGYGYGYGYATRQKPKSRTADILKRLRR